jgi:hypothetical protein
MKRGDKKMGEIIFVIGILIWCFIGFLGGLHAKENRVNYEMIVFMVLALFIPIFAMACGLT